MPGRNYYLITSLPSLAELGSAPPLRPAELLQAAVDAGGPREIVEALFLGDDLVQREALLAGEIEQAQPVVLSAAQLRDQEPLPAYLAGEGPPPPHLRVAADAVWAAYFHHAANVARQQGSTFLAEWVRFEVTLRGALASARAKVLGLDAAGYQVAPELGGEPDDLAGVLNEWSAAPNPLAGLRVLDNARWAWLTENEQWFSFGDDELAAYAAKLMLLHRWHRLAQPSAAPAPGDAGRAASSERTLP